VREYCYTRVVREKEGANVGSDGDVQDGGDKEEETPQKARSIVTWYNVGNKKAAWPLKRCAGSTYHR